MTSRADKSQTDLRIRQAVVQQALQLYKTVARRKRGQVIFLAGYPGSGRTATLHALAEVLHRERPRPVVIAGGFKAGKYEAGETDQAVKVPLKKIMAALGQTMPLAASVTNPMVGFMATFIGQLLQASATDWDLVDNLRRKGKSLPDSPEALKILLRRAAKAQPVVCLIDDLDEAEGSWLSDFVLTFAPEIATDLSLLLFLSMEGPMDLGPHEQEESDRLYLARRLTEEKDGPGQWWPLKPLSRDEIAAWLGPAEPDVVARLYAVTGGNPQWVKQLWEDWRERGVVRQSSQNQQWQVVPGHEVRSLGQVNDIFQDRLKRLLGRDDAPSLDKTRYLLSCAALEGRHFTAEAVARVLGRDQDELISFLDNILV